jgi:hypothetical protein
MTRGASILTRVIHGAADRLAMDQSIPANSREAFRATVVCVIEQQVRDIIGYDEVRIRGWSVLPSVRAARLRRINEAVRSGEEPAAIARRECVSTQYVRRLRAKLMCR